MKMKIRNQAHYDSLQEAGVTPFTLTPADATYSCWRDPRTDTWEVVHWKHGKASIVQCNIPTKAKAVEARNIWRERQRIQDMASNRQPC